MSSIGAVSGGVTMPMAHPGQATKKIDRDGDYDNNKPESPANEVKEAQTSQQKLNIKA